MQPFSHTSDARTWVTYGPLFLRRRDGPRCHRPSFEPGSGLQRRLPSGSRACRHTRSAGGNLRPPFPARACQGDAGLQERGPARLRLTTRAWQGCQRRETDAGYPPCLWEWWEEVNAGKHHTSCPRCRLHSGQPDRLPARPSRSPALVRSLPPAPSFHKWGFSSALIWEHR